MKAIPKASRRVGKQKMEAFESSALTSAWEHQPRTMTPLGDPISGEQPTIVSVAAGWRSRTASKAARSSGPPLNSHSRPTKTIPWLA